MVKQVNEVEFAKEIANGTVLVDFFATWCGPCKMLSPIIDEIAKENTDIKVLKVDVDEADNLAAELQISSIPTIMVFKDGKLYKRNVGFIPKPKVLDLLK